jgi:hypothetical protein
MAQRRAEALNVEDACQAENSVFVETVLRETLR